MNKNCSKSLLRSVLFIANRYYSRYELTKSDALPNVVVGCEFSDESVIRTNGDHHGYSTFLQMLFLTRFGKPIGTRVPVNGHMYTVGRCAEQRACRFLLDKLPTKLHTESTVDSLVFSEPYYVRDLKKKKATRMNNCIICKTIFR